MEYVPNTVKTKSRSQGLKRAPSVSEWDRVMAFYYWRWGDISTFKVIHTSKLWGACLARRGKAHGLAAPGDNEEHGVCRVQEQIGQDFGPKVLSGRQTDHSLWRGGGRAWPAGIFLPRNTWLGDWGGLGDTSTKSVISCPKSHSNNTVKCSLEIGPVSKTEAGERWLLQRNEHHLIIL